LAHSDLEEILAAIKAVRDISKKPLIASITYKKTKRGFFTIMGDSLEKCVKTLSNEEVDVVGANCTIGSNDMLELLKLAKNYTNKPISVKPNAGQPIVEDSKTYYNQPVEEFASDIREMIKLGAKIVGGCCGTSPKTIMSIRKIIDSI
jgi:5-methyltetrahydrofolate--homocysteine methyltransferase